MSRASWPVPVIWPGETAVIVAGGPSVDLRQIRLIARAHLAGGCRVIAVNDSVYPCWWADWLHACDQKWWLWHRETAVKFPGTRTTTDEAVPEEWAHLLRRIAPDKRTGFCGGFAEEPDAVCTGGNSGYQAIQIAVKAGAMKVVLVGFDMKPRRENGDFAVHWFGDHPDGVRSDFNATMLPHFPSLVEPLAERGVEVINATPGSALDCFPRADLAEILS